MNKTSFSGWNGTQIYLYYIVTHALSFLLHCGTSYWFAFSNVLYSNSHAIVSLKLRIQSYQEISQPDYGMMSVASKLGMLRDCLCLVFHSDSVHDVWFMKESWIKLIRFLYFGDFII